MRGETTIGYFPTIEGKPARFNGNQICFCNNCWALALTPTRRQVHRQIQKTIAYRRANGMSEADVWRYGIQRATNGQRKAKR